MKDGFIKIAAVTPNLKVADVAYNTAEIVKLFHQASDAGAKLIVFPKLCLTGCSLGDLIMQSALLQAAADGIQMIAKETKGSDSVVVVGFPDPVSGQPVTAFIQNGTVLATVAKP